MEEVHISLETHSEMQTSLETHSEVQGGMHNYVCFDCYHISIFSTKLTSTHHHYRHSAQKQGHL